MLVSLVLISLAVAANAQYELSGVYFYGGEVESFYPCGTDQALWVVASQGELTQARAAADQLRSAQQPYPPLFLEIVGRDEGKDASGGFAEAYDGVFRVSAVRSVSKNIPASCSNSGL